MTFVTLRKSQAIVMIMLFDTVMMLQLSIAKPSITVVVEEMVIGLKQNPTVNLLA